MVLQKHDKAAVDGVHAERTSSCMKTRYRRLEWLIPVLGIGLVVGGMMAATTYVRLERDTQSAQSLANTLEHLYQDQTISLALRKIRAGEVAAAAQQLDVLLCDDVLQLNANACKLICKCRNISNLGLVLFGVLPHYAGDAAFR